MKARNLIAMPVVLMEEAVVMGSVGDVVVEGFKVKGLVIEGKDGKKHFIACDDFTIGQDSVLISSRAGLKPYEERGKSTYRSRMGEAIIDSGGREIGTLSDLVIAPESKTTTGVEVSSGIIQDFLEGKRGEVPLDKIEASGAELMLVQRDEGS